jgi:predicted RNase H-like HicB family nuclease
MERLVLTAKVAQEENGYVAIVEHLPLQGTGESLEEAQDRLIQTLRAWIELHDGQGNLGEVLAQAGFPGVGEDTEFQLEFLEESINA